MKFINGWTKEKVIEHVKENFKGKAETAFTCAYSTNAYAVEHEEADATMLNKCDDQRCAVGLFIPDGHVGLSCEGDVYDLLGEYPDLKKHMPLGEKDLKDWQHIHDKLNATDSVDDQTEELINFITRD